MVLIPYYALSLVAKGIGFTCLPKDLIDTQHIFYDSLCFINDDAIPLDKKTLSIIWQDGADNYELCRKVISEIKTEIF